MALVRGTNCGFVSVSPNADPGATGDDIDEFAIAFKDTSPAGATKVTEIGWYCDNATEAANFEVGIYTQNEGDDNPEAVVGALSQTNAKGTSAGWKKVTGLNIAISGGVEYWIAIQLDNTATNTQLDKTADVTAKYDYIQVATLPDPWGASAGTGTERRAIYAVVEIDGGGGDGDGGQDGPYVY